MSVNPDVSFVSYSIIWVTLWSLCVVESVMCQFVPPVLISPDAYSVKMALSPFLFVFLKITYHFLRKWYMQVMLQDSCENDTCITRCVRTQQNQTSFNTNPNKEKSFYFTNLQFILSQLWQTPCATSNNLSAALTVPSFGSWQPGYTGHSNQRALVSANMQQYIHQYHPLNHF